MNEAKPESTRFPLALCAGLGALAFVVHATSLRGPFVFDDFPTVVNNPSLTGSSTFLELLLAARFRPLLNLSYALDHAVWGFNPLGFHLTNVLLHTANTLLVFGLGWHWEQDGARRSPPTSGVAPVAAILFGLHPLMTEGVSYVTGRSEVLCGLFFVSGLLMARRAIVTAQKRWLAGSFLLLVCGLACKEIAALMPIAALAYGRLRLEPEEQRRRALTWLAPGLALVVLGGAGRALFYLSAETALGPSAIARNFQLQLIVLWRYLGLLVFPIGQSLVHPFVEPQGLDPIAVLAGVALLAVGVGLFRTRHRFPAAAFGAAWFVLLLVPSSSLIPLSEPMSEHRTYVANIGLFLAAAAGAARLFPWLKGKSAAAPKVALGVVCLGLGALTVARNRVWSDARNLWGEAAETAPRVWAAQYGLGEALQAAGECGKAIPAFEAAIALLPDQPRAYVSLGICQATVGHPGAAYRAFARAQTLSPRDPKVLTNLGTLALLVGNPATARASFQQAAELDPGDPARRQRVASAGTGPDTAPWPPQGP